MLTRSGKDYRPRNMNKGVTSKLMKMLVEQQKALAEQCEQARVQHEQALE